MIAALQPRHNKPTIHLSHLHKSAQRHIIQGRPLHRINRCQPRPAYNLRHSNTTPKLNRSLIRARRTINVHPPRSMSQLVKVARYSRLYPVDNRLLRRLRLHQINILMLIRMSHSRLRSVHQQTLHSRRHNPSSRLNMIRRPNRSRSIRVLHMSHNNQNHRQVNDKRHLQQRAGKLNPYSMKTRLINRSATNPNQLRLKKGIQQLTRSLTRRHLLLQDSRRTRTKVHQHRRPVHRQIRDNNSKRNLIAKYRTLS